LKRIILGLFTILSTAALVAGSTRAVFSASDQITGNIITNGTVTLLAHNFTGNKPIGTTTTSLVPGMWTPEGRAELYNTGTVPVKLYMYVDNLGGTGACSKVNLQVNTGYSGNYADEHARVVFATNINNLVGPTHKVELTGSPPWQSLPASWTQVIWQKAQLDPLADDSYQGLTCTWTEYFVAESL